MTYHADITALKAMAAHTLSRWRRRPHYELGSLKTKCERCCLPVPPSLRCLRCEALYTYTGPLPDRSSQ